MRSTPEGNAIVYCERAFGTLNGKTAHGLVRRTSRYRILSVIDSMYAGSDAGMVLDGKMRDIPIYTNLKVALERAHAEEKSVSFFVIGLAPDGGRLGAEAKEAVKEAITLGLNVDSGLHDFLSDDSKIAQLAERQQIQIRDIRKPAPRNKLHFFSGKIEDVMSFRVAVLGTDSAVGKRTTAWLLVDAFENVNLKTEFIGTGQTAWMQGARYGIVLDSLVNDFVTGELEHVVWSAWNESRPEVMIIEGQGSLMNPAFPGGFEILAAARPDVVVLQHAPARKDYDSFPGYPIHPLEKQIQAIELISSKPVVAISINHENIPREKIPEICDSIYQKTGIPTFDVLLNGADQIVAIILKKYGLQ